MPCYLCGTRQVDPDRGKSPWARGVRRGHQVLVCPACQAASDWAAEFDRCGRCGSFHLIRRLDEVECRDCGCVRLAAEPSPGPAGTPDASGPGGPDAALAGEVERALARVLGRSCGAVPAGHPGRERRTGG